MRKLLLAGAAGVGALSLATPQASAQTTQITAPTSAAPVIRSEPGMSIRLAGRYRVYGAYAQSDFQNDQQSNPPSNNAAGNAPTNNSPVGAKVTSTNFDMFDYARLWTGMDGMAQNGLRYGAALEIRMQDGSGGRGNARGVLTYRRMYGYVATPTLGQVRAGTGQVRASELMYTGHIMGSIASGLWDGDLPAAIVGPGAASVFWYSASSGNNATAISYLSPQFFGFDAGLSWAPNNGNFGGDASCGVQQYTTTNGGANCDRLSESNLDSQTVRVRNIWDVMLRYRGSFGPVGVVVSGGVVGSDTVGATGNAQSYDNVFVGLGGTQITFAGVTVGGIITGGKANYATTNRANQTIAVTNITGAALTNTTTSYGAGTPLVPLPSSGNNDNLFTWQLGIMYTIGPFTVGAAYHEARYEGSTAVSANAKDQGLGIGAAYAVAPGFNLYAEYLWGQREENGMNLRTGQVNPSTNSSLNSKGQTNVFGVGMAFNW